MCFKSFPIDEVEQHADGCSASFALITERNREGCVSTNENSTVELVNIEESKSNGCTLLECITNLKDAGLKSKMEMVRVTVRRKMVWEDFKRSRYWYYEPERILKVTFAGEPAVDDGGPKREFFAGRLFYNIVIAGHTTCKSSVLNLHNLCIHSLPENVRGKGVFFFRPTLSTKCSYYIKC